ncbi:3'-phosphatase, 5'-polynucleotide kinase [Pseudomonas phage ZQG1]|nr:3'-phosphatase, 5'-polynucleotide kinase [Pseudomonas phage ZQG1]
MYNKPYYIFDLDGTLALCDHRAHFIDGSKPKKDWDAYFEACSYDEPNPMVIDVLHALRQSGHGIAIWTGRSIKVQDQTVKWLLSKGIMKFNLRMRPEGCKIPDYRLKQQWWANLEQPQRWMCRGVFEDRQQVVDMWRKEGLTCFQVAPGNF